MFTPFLLLVFFLAPCFAQESHQDIQKIINQAQDFTLQHDRANATQVLIHAIKLQKPNSPAALKLKNALTNLSEIFYQEPAQKKYELAQSMSETKLASATEKYQEALELEPGNVSILKALTWAEIRLRDCSHASNSADKALEMNPYSSDLQLLKAQSLQCLERHEDLKLYLGQHQDLARVERPYLDLIVLRELVSQKKWTEVKRKVRDIEQYDPHFPEGWRWSFEASLKTKTPSRDMAEQYMKACRKPSDALREKYHREPTLCLAEAEMERALKSLSNQDSKVSE